MIMKITLKMKRIVRLTESNLRNIVRNSVNRILREDYDSQPSAPGGNKKLVYEKSIDINFAGEIADKYGYETEDEAALEYFSSIEIDPKRFYVRPINKDCRFIGRVDGGRYGAFEVYWNGTSEVYFMARDSKGIFFDNNDANTADFGEPQMNFESIVRRSVNESLANLLEMEGAPAPGGGGAGNVSGALLGGGDNPEAGTYTTAFPAKEDDEVYNTEGGFSVEGKAKWNNNTKIKSNNKGGFPIISREVYKPKTGKNSKK
jgi:hypothetical protein